MSSLLNYFSPTSEGGTAEGGTAEEEPCNIMEDVVSILPEDEGSPQEENFFEKDVTDCKHSEHPLHSEEELRYLRLEYEASLLRKINLSMIQNRIELIQKFQNFGIMAFSTVTLICATSLFSDDLAIISWLLSTAGLLSVIPSEILFGGVYLGSNNKKLCEQLQLYSSLFGDKQGRDILNDIVITRKEVEDLKKVN